MHRSNKKIIEILQRVVHMKQEELSEMPRATTPDIKRQKQSRRFAIAALQNGISELINYDGGEIVSGESVSHLPGIGKGIAKRIDEIIETGNLEELKDFRGSIKEDKVFTESVAALSTIFGLGPRGARRFAHMGIHTPAQLALAVESGAVTVTEDVKAGIRFHMDLLERIPRSEMDVYNREFKRMIKDLPAGTQVDILGSYRRRSPDCGDVDVLLTGSKPHAGTLRIFLARLEDSGILVAHLGEGESKFAGIIKHRRFEKARRLDAREVPQEAYPFAKLYYTGSKEHNIVMRARALKLGYSLSEYGVKKTKTGEFVKGIETEKDIFKFLDMKYVKPEDR